MKKLELLDLSANLFETIESSPFRHMWKLERLDLSANHIEAIDSDTFQGLFHLNFLDLSSNHNMHMTNGSEPFRYLTDLIELRVCMNKTCANASFAGLSRLQRLQLHSADWLHPQPNRVVAIFEQMPSLRLLSLSSFKLIDTLVNQKTNMDDKKWLRLLFPRLLEVKIVDLCHTFHDNPTCTHMFGHFLDNLPQLQSISIESVHQEGGQLAPGLFSESKSRRLVALSLKNMALANIRDLQYTHLRELDLSSNRLKLLREDQFAALVGLERLNLANNLLDRVTAGAFRRLQELNLSRNTLYKLDECMFVDVPTLEKLNMSHNSALNFPRHIFAPLVDLIDLDISFSMGPVSVLHGDLLVKQTRLRHLNAKIPRTQCVFEASLFANLSSLETLVYSHAKKVTSVENLFVPLAATLTELEFHYDNVSCPEVADGCMFKCMVNLRKLHLISESAQLPVESAFSCLSKLEHWHLSDPLKRYGVKRWEIEVNGPGRGALASMPSIKSFRVTNIALMHHAPDCGVLTPLEYSHPFLSFISDD